MHPRLPAPDPRDPNRGESSLAGREGFLLPRGDVQRDARVSTDMLPISEDVETDEIELVGRPGRLAVLPLPRKIQPDTRERPTVREDQPRTLIDGRVQDVPYLL